MNQPSLLQRLTKSALRILLAIVILVPAVSAVIGWLTAPLLLHPPRRELTASDRREADAAFSWLGAIRTDFDVRAADGTLLRGWKVHGARPNGDWVLLFHGVADNRMGVLGHAVFLLGKGYCVVMMDARAHGASGGAMATYGWLERHDTRSVVDALEASEHVSHLFALSESMGAGIALESAAVEPRIEAVVAEAPFSDLREAAYDYAGLHQSPWLGKTLFRPGAWAMIRRGERDGGFRVTDASPERAVATRAFPLLLVCDGADHTLPCRHAERIFHAARGPAQFWRVPGAFHTAALGFAPDEFEHRVLALFGSVR
jgi:alpha-beta hydrolase superfamily lysophospholipase